ncbi:hypothetical protein ASG12_17615 [Williamsia sp. Leaf354]|jgi:hypothetical protein|uniref:hypothetical protein n=1 Tax=Williamsia sp. Leaf354 TaxID=1736349 RepID=UPI0006FDBDB7|nr:hypothetical protein [Williamsia sp. Leaf354]KQR96053.1 hypothetical protein ASG12_17615 [Williamsia sp. Leaf354]
MRIKKILIGTVAAGGIGLASLGAGAGVASAAPTAVASHQSTQNHEQIGYASPSRPTVAPGPVRRPDTRPFEFRGQRVTPQFRADHHGWGFWFFGFWVPLAL